LSKYGLRGRRENEYFPNVQAVYLVLPGKILPLGMVAASMRELGVVVP
jgi:hypothetical protein